MARWIPLILGLPLIAISTYIQGSWTHRWSHQPNTELMQLVERYQSIPTMIGEEWVGEDTPYSKKELEAAGAYAHLSRSYHNRETGDRISIFMVCGYARDIAIHTPDFCYVGAGFEVENPPTQVVIPIAGNDTDAECWTSTFLKEGGAATVHQRILWGWTNGESWNAPNNPRLKFPGNSVLNKVYVITNIQGGKDELNEEHPAVQFGELFLPIVREKLYPPASDPELAEPRS